MSDRVFVDTNVLVYASVDDDPRCSLSARRLMLGIRRDQLVISTQVLLEFANVIIRRFGVTGPALRQTLELQKLAEVRDTTRDDVFDAVRLTQQASINIFDAMIVVAAAKAGCSVLYTEDLNHGQVIAGVRVVNPFKPEDPA